MNAGLAGIDSRGMLPCLLLQIHSMHLNIIWLVITAYGHLTTGLEEEAPLEAFRFPGEIYQVLWNPLLDAVSNFSLPAHTPGSN